MIGPFVLESLMSYTPNLSSLELNSPVTEDSRLFSTEAKRLVGKMLVFSSRVYCLSNIEMDATYTGNTCFAIL